MLKNVIDFRTPNRGRQVVVLKDGIIVTRHFLVLSKNKDFKYTVKIGKYYSGFIPFSSVIEFIQKYRFFLLLDELFEIE